MSRNWNSMLCPIYEKKLTANMEFFKTIKLNRSSDVVFEVLSLNGNYRVDLSRLSCSYNLWQIKGFPCSHVVASINSIGGSLYDYYHQLFLTCTLWLSYSQSIQPILMSIDDSEVPDNPAILSSDAKRPSGRPKKYRDENRGLSPKRKMKCSRCNLYENHNKSTCTVNND